MSKNSTGIKRNRALLFHHVQISASTAKYCRNIRILKCWVSKKTVNDPYRQARELLPNMPEEIFRLWFDERIEANGWPPVSDTWMGALRDRPLSYWKRLNWKKEVLSLDFCSFMAPAQRIINGLIEANLYGMQNEYSEIENSRSRMHKILDYIQANRMLPGTVILLRENESLEIVDGSHRLSVFFSLKSQGLSDELLPKEQEVWLGEL